MVVRQPGLTAAAVLALALGVGLTTLLFSIGYGIFLRGLPLPEGRRIMAVTLTNTATGRQKLAVGIHDFADWRAAQRSFDDLAAFDYASLNVVVRDGQPERLRGALLTANGMELLHARPLMGRTFVPNDGAPDAAPVLVLGYGVWTTLFGGDPHVIGRTVRADGEPATIVGVMPAGFGFPQSQEAWMVLRADPLQVPRGLGPTVMVYGRLRPGVAAAGAQADLGTIAGRLAREHPDTNRNLVPVVQPYTQAMSSNAEGVLFMLLTLALGFGVLLVACANVANLMFARAAARTREVAIRTALGAGRRRLVAQLLAETAVLAVARHGRRPAARPRRDPAVQPGHRGLAAALLGQGRARSGGAAVCRRPDGPERGPVGCGARLAGVPRGRQRSAQRTARGRADCASAAPAACW